MAERAGWHLGIALWDARQQGTQGNAAGTAAGDPRSCTEMRQDPDSGAECRKQKTAVYYWALGSGTRE